MPKKSRMQIGKYFPRKESMQTIQQERQSLRKILEDRNMYQSRMRLQEMRDICLAVEKSEHDYRTNEENYRYLDDFETNTTSYMLDVHMEILRQQNSLRSWEDPNEMNGFLSMAETCPSVIPSPESLPPTQDVPTLSPQSLLDFEILPYQVKSSNMPDCVDFTPPALPEIVSDDEDYYSPCFPGPCCRIEHIVKVEIHSEPSEQMQNCNPREYTAPLKKPRFRNRMFPLSPEWDSIGELV
ncbi:uncharacterized protein LOC131692304 [Topomyia yanbarensis]|uniref:uncharacterized protein LOC131692304 n=1 Tax=Topomyia yanbarensis TaxID=2498891 RepID=UPI00273C26F8|nr:uncharacterized protein LOC131692304 [Topomyia yanbarensis]